MSSMSSPFRSHLVSHHFARAHHHDSPSSAPPSSHPQYQLCNDQFLADALIQLQHPADFAVVDPPRSTHWAANADPNPTGRIFHPVSAPLTPTFPPCHHSHIRGGPPSRHDWAMQPTSMGRSGLKRSRSHQRTPSASTVESTSPDSPYVQNINHPLIANPEFSPNSPAHYYADQASVGFSKTLPTPSHTPVDGSCLTSGYVPGTLANPPPAHQAMKAFAIDHHNFEDFAPDFTTSSRQSMSSYGNESPSTPQSGAGDNVDTKHYNAQANEFRQPNPNVQLFRTESQAYQDELYNPPSVPAPIPASNPKPATTYLSPHRNVMTERLQTANIARSQSPRSMVSRERSPFRDGSPLAPVTGWTAPAAGVGTAAGMRQKQKEEAEQAEYAQHRPQLRREPTKTISPKDALLDYSEPDQSSLFRDSVPVGYKQHSASGTETWPNGFVSQPGSAFGTLQHPGQSTVTNFRATAADGLAGPEPFGAFVPLPPCHGFEPGQIPNAAFGGNSYAVPKMSPYLTVDANPPFPATLTSMESSMSDNGPPPSSQESDQPTSASRRPVDTRANTGAYTCTYHGCTQRFDSHANLQKHKRDFHRSQAQQQRESSAASVSDDSSSSTSRSTDSPAPPANSMTSAAILARNSQAGPHKCARTNPSTGKPCNAIFSRPYDLTRHEDTIHNGRKQKVRCPMCREEKTFSRNDALTRHMRVVHPEVESFGKRGRRGE